MANFRRLVAAQVVLDFPWDGTRLPERDDRGASLVDLAGGGNGRKECQILPRRFLIQIHQDHGAWASARLAGTSGARKQGEGEKRENFGAHVGSESLK